MFIGRGHRLGEGESDEFFIDRIFWRCVRSFLAGLCESAVEWCERSEQTEGSCLQESKGRMNNEPRNIATLGMSMRMEGSRPKEYDKLSR